MAHAEAEGARMAGAEVDVKRVPELVAHKVAISSHYKLDQIAPIAHIDDLIDYDAIIFGTPTRFGNMAAQMKNFLDQAGGLWAKDKLVGKLHCNGEPARRPGSYPPVVPHRALSSWIHRHWTAVLIQGTAGH